MQNSFYYFEYHASPMSKLNQSTINPLLKKNQNSSLLLPKHVSITVVEVLITRPTILLKKYKLVCETQKLLIYCLNFI